MPFRAYSVVLKLIKLFTLFSCVAISKSEYIRIIEKSIDFGYKLKLSNKQHALVKGQLEAGATAARVARQFGVNEKIIRRERTQFATHGGVADIARSGRPLKIGIFSFTQLRNRFASPNDTARNAAGLNRPRISTRTARRRLKAVGLRCRRPILTPNHRRLDPFTGSMGITSSKMTLKSFFTILLFILFIIISSF